MYSFYRAWLMHDAFQSSIGNPPDVLLQVGPTGTQFAAHRAILISHSGYFKSVFAHPTNPIVVPNVGVPEFTSLLTWMYTGFLDLNLENIYNILLATHLLHMPNALEICRNFLIQNNQLLNENRISTTNTTSSATSGSFPSQTTNSTTGVINQQTPSTSSYLQHNIIKPIPSRKFLPDTFRNFLPILPTNLKTNENTSFHKIQTLATTSEQQQSPPPPPSSFREDNNNIQQRSDDVQSPEIIDLKKRSSPEKIIEIVKVTSPKPSTSFHRKSPSLSGSLSPNLSEKSDAVILEYPPVKKYTKKLKQTQFVKSKSDKVIIDIACCDGPVRFHRVLNNCYGIANPTVNNTVTTTKIETNKTSDLMNKIMTHEMNNRRNKKMHENSDESSDIVYTCVYCNHTFKSQYCYQKHARRHINPVTLSSTCKVINNEPQQQNSEDIASSARKSSPPMSNTAPVGNTIASDTNPATQVNGLVSATGTKREVKLLDMNVQYYPCKTCGSKFPSYYFVHKHRKMYHADEIEKESESGSQNADDAASKHTTSNSSPIPPNKENDV